jgi:hypothetical protein
VVVNDDGDDDFDNDLFLSFCWPALRVWDSINAGKESDEQVLFNVRY